MRVSVFGLGYVGVVCSACWARDGHTVVGVDPNRVKVDLVNRGETPVIEEGLGELIAAGVRSGRLRATLSAAEAFSDSEVSLICVGTPSQLNGNLDTSYVRRVCEQLGGLLAGASSYHVVVVRSTVLPGTCRDVVIPTLEQTSGKKAGVDFGVCTNPEFLREGSAIADFDSPPKTIIGATDVRSSDVVAALYEDLAAPLIRTDLATAETVKYADNAWHAMKICFANEIGSLCKAAGVDGPRVMEIFCQDTKLNISKNYLRPGFAFGGSCLPKDIRALTYKARTLDLELPLLSSVLPSNRRHIERALQMIMATGKKKVGVIGLSFKEGTDDLRESPLVEVVERLLGKGYDLRIYDRNVRLASLVGANKDYILNHIPHLARLLAPELQQVLDHAEVLVVGSSDQMAADLVSSLPAHHVIDLVRLGKDGEPSGERYEGICW